MAVGPSIRCSGAGLAKQCGAQPLESNRVWKNKQRRNPKGDKALVRHSRWEGAATDSGTAWSLTSPTAGSQAWQRLGDAALQYATEDGVAKGITSIMKNCLAKLAMTFLANVESVNQALQVVQETNLHP